MKKIFLFICVSLYFTIDTVAQADMIVDGDAVISGNTIIGLPGINSTFSVNGIGVIRQPDVRQYVFPNWTPNATTKRVIVSYVDGQGINAPVTRFYGPLSNFADIGVDTLGHFILQTGDVTRMTVLQDGKVGIGVLDPIELLDVNGGLHLGNTASTNNGTIRFNGTDLEGYVGSNWKSLTTENFWNQSLLGIDFQGYVGIGTDTPASHLDVEGTITVSSSAGTTGLDMSTADSYADMRVIRNTNSTIDDNLYLNLGADPNGEIKLYSSGLETMTIENGNVGIGTATPASKLEVAGALTVTVPSTSTGLDLSTSNAYADMRVIRNINSGIDDNLYLNFGAATGGEVVLYSDGLETLRAGNGNVGIGFQPSVVPTIKLVVPETSNLGTLICTGTSGISEAFNNVGFNVSPVTGTTIGFLVRNGQPGMLENAFSVLAVTGDGQFEHDLNVIGNISKGGGSFKIDHPLDPENKYLYHSFVESPDMMNVYNGNTTTDANGQATVELPDYFESLNRDFRYQLTAIGTFSQVIIKEKLENNVFVIASSEPNVEVSWQITGIRQDAYANKNRIPNEVEKVGAEKGLYLHPEAFNLPSSKKIKVESETFQDNVSQKEKLNKGLIVKEKL